VSKALFAASQNHQLANDEAEQAQKAIDEVDKMIREAGESGQLLDLSQIPFVASSEIIKTIRANLVMAKTDLAALQVKYLEKWPAVIEAKERIVKLTEEIQKVAQDEIDLLREQARYQQARATRALDSLNARQADMNRLNQLKVEYDNLVM